MLTRRIEGLATDSQGEGNDGVYIGAYHAQTISAESWGGVQDTPHGVEGDSHSGPKPLVPYSLTQVPCSKIDQARLLKGHTRRRDRTNSISRQGGRMPHWETRSDHVGRLLHHASTRHQAAGEGSKADKGGKTERAPKQTKTNETRKKGRSPKQKKQEGGKSSDDWAAGRKQKPQDVKTRERRGSSFSQLGLQPNHTGLTAQSLFFLEESRRVKRSDTQTSSNFSNYFKRVLKLQKRFF